MRRLWLIGLIGLIGSPAFADAVVVRAANSVLLESVSQHKQNYLLPLTYRHRQGSYKNSELIFQFSAKVSALIPNVYFAYTQQSFWQYMRKQDSSPFRETNYNPEVFYDWRLVDNDAHLLGVYLGFEHQSNGQSLPLSRSWDRFYLWTYWQNHGGEYSAKIWYRRPENPKKTPLDANGDDNPDIARYLGYGELYYTRQRQRDYGVAAMLRLNPKSGKGALQFDYSLPLRNENSYVFIRLFTGYGESLIDYNRDITRLSLGIEFR